MKKLTYNIYKNKVWVEVYDTKYKIPMNFKAIYSGVNNKDCENWLKEYKKGLIV